MGSAQLFPQQTQYSSSESKQVEQYVGDLLVFLGQVGVFLLKVDLLELEALIRHEVVQLVVELARVITMLKGNDF